VRLCFLLVRRVPPVESPVLRDVFDLLRRRGVDVHGGIAEETVTPLQDLHPAHDLYVLKSHTELSLGLAGILHDRGARVYNPYPACAAAQNKLMATARLAAAGVPVPVSWATGDLALMGPAAGDRPLIVKPYLGHRGRGIRSGPAADLGTLAAEETVIVQEHVPTTTGTDLKLYVVGSEVFGVRKPFSAESFTVPGRPCPVDPETAAVARRCGEALGLGLYGVDVVDSPDGPVVVDVNYFPGYKGVPDVAPLIADHLFGVATGAITPAEPASAIV
jgi:glutathione synthase/RimK-type ligase-like ATP-grasp enzyme